MEKYMKDRVEKIALSWKFNYYKIFIMDKIIYSIVSVFGFNYTIY